MSYEAVTGEPRAPGSWHPPLTTSAQLLEALVERYAVALNHEDEEYAQHLSQYGLAAGSLGLVSMEAADVSFEKTAHLGSDGEPEAADHIVYVASGNDVVLTARAFSDKHEVVGGYGEAGLNGDLALDDESVRTFITKLSAAMWLRQMELDTPELSQEAVCRSIIDIVSWLAKTPSDRMGTGSEEFCDIYPIDFDTVTWSGIRAERWIGEPGVLWYELNLLDRDDAAIDLSVNGSTGQLCVSNYSGTEFEGEDANKRARIVFSTLARAISENKIKGLDSFGDFVD